MPIRSWFKRKYVWQKGCRIGTAFRSSKIPRETEPIAITQHLVHYSFRGLVSDFSVVGACPRARRMTVLIFLELGASGTFGNHGRFGSEVWRWITVRVSCTIGAIQFASPSNQIIMASVYIEEQNRTISNPEEISAFLSPFGIWYEHWQVEGRLKSDATDADILSEYAPEIDAVKSKGGYVTADVINVSSNTPNLDVMLAKFNKEHTHSEDEVRFTVSGKGIFHLHPENGPVFGVTVESGDMINVPRGMKHWFNLCDDRHIRCIRFFEDASGWTPHYIDQGVHEQYSPMCFGGNYLEKQSVVSRNFQAKPIGG